MGERVLNRLRLVFERIQKMGSVDRVVLIVSCSPSLQHATRIAAIQERWHAVYARSVSDAVQIVRVTRVCVVVYDTETSGVPWTASIGKLLYAGSAAPAFILLTRDVSALTWRSVLDRGGFDAVEAGVATSCLTEKINSALSLAVSVNFPVAEMNGLPPR